MKSGIRIIKKMLNERPDYTIGPPLGHFGIEVHKNIPWDNQMPIIQGFGYGRLIGWELAV